jgi:hypothetical protein
MQTIEKDCSSISGTYENQGQYERYTGNAQPYLATKFLGSANRVDRELDEADLVNIAVTKDGILEILVLTHGEQVRTKRYSERKGEYHCDHGTIQLTYGTGDFYLIVAGVGRVSIAISKSIDGELIVKESATHVGYVLIIPAVASTTTWSHFRPREAMKPKLPLEPDAAQAPE